MAHLLESVHALLEDSVAHEDEHDGHLRVDEGQGAVLQLARLDSLAVHVGQLLDLEGTLQAGGEVEAPAHDEEGALLVESAGDLKDLVVLLKDL